MRGRVEQHNIEWVKTFMFVFSFPFELLIQVLEMVRSKYPGLSDGAVMCFKFIRIITYLRHVCNVGNTGHQWPVANYNYLRVPLWREGCVQRFIGCSWTMGAWSTVQERFCRFLFQHFKKTWGQISVKLHWLYSYVASSTCGGKWVRSYVTWLKEPMNVARYVTSIKMARRRRSWTVETVDNDVTSLLY